MALVKTKTKTENGWIYRGFNLVKSGSKWLVDFGTSDLELNDNIQSFLDATHKQLKKSCEIIDGFYEGKTYTTEVSAKDTEKQSKMKESWDKFHKDSRTKKGLEIFKEIIPNLKGLHFGQQKKSIDAKGNVRFYWLPINTDYEVYKGYPTWNEDILEEFKDKFKDEIILHNNSSYDFTIEVIMSDKALSDYFLASTL